MTNLQSDLTAEKAAEARQKVTLAPSRADYRERWYYKEASPFKRIAKLQFQRDGLLLPFGHPRLGFNKPNPTLFSGQKWPMSDQADPSDGWPISDIIASSFPASNDWYGKLYTYLHGLLYKFVQRIGTANLHVELFNVDANILPQYVQIGKYSRIEVSNICDAGYIGIRKTLSLFTPHLVAKKTNPYATIITLFLNAVKEQELTEGRKEMPNMECIFQYIPPTKFSRVPFEMDADFYRIHDAAYLMVDSEAKFRRYMSRLGFDKCSEDLGIIMKVKNTIVEEWPTRLKLRPGQRGAEDEFRNNLGSGFTSLERYVEWKIV
ncbi:hypothetical protein NOR_07081 [Metarhizium rileyi]|uniref:Uncharacterized protein n=1 Tax=Metarhizium rileyi (strain RCEF 4871) TaxID=1649241 RepID=A0A166YZ80_METRR|nr:hypothetical protein NOR_07081 [Metarhizium rileyi RCEF 4871]TWU70516.1 hypothetical protein ED733_000605 [Metarhizium rileyi]